MKTIEGVHKVPPSRSPVCIYDLLVGLPSFAWDFYCLLCLFVSLSICLSPLSLFLSISTIYLSISPLYLSISPIYLSFSPLYLSLFLPHSPSLFPDKKFPSLGLIPSFRSKCSSYTFIFIFAIN